MEAGNDPVGVGGQCEGGVKLLKPWSKNTEGDAKECLDLSSSSILLCLAAGNPTKAPRNQKSTQRKIQHIPKCWATIGDETGRR